MKLIHTSDWQLGMTRWFLEPDGGGAQARLHEGCLNAIDRIGELTTSEDAEFIVVAGDVLDSSTLSDKMFLQALERIAKLPVPMYLLPGDHDALDASSILRRSASESSEDRGVHIIRGSKPTSVRDGVEFIGVPVHGEYSTDDTVAEIVTELESADGIRMMVVHDQVEGFSADAGTTIDLTSLEQAVDREVLHYVAPGDSHSMSQLDHAGKTYFSGAYETIAYDDRGRDSGNMLVVEIAKDDPVKDSITVASHRVGQQTFYVIDMDITDTEGLDEFFAELGSIEAKIDTTMEYSL